MKNERGKKRMAGEFSLAVGKKTKKKEGGRGNVPLLSFCVTA